MERAGQLLDIWASAQGLSAVGARAGIGAKSMLTL